LIIVILSVMSLGWGLEVGDPIPPVSWPLTWSSWVVVSMVDSSLPPPVQMIYNWGQWLAYDPTNQIACRYDQQDLSDTSSPNRTIDNCDYTGLPL